MLTNTGTRKPIPRIDDDKKIPIIPACIRYIFHTNFFWAVAEVNGEEFSTPGCHKMSEARWMAMEQGKMYAIRRWQLMNYM